MADWIQRYGYDFREDGSIIPVDPVALMGDKDAQDALQKRLKAEQHRGADEPGIRMHGSGGPVRSPHRVPPDDWVRPTLRIGSERTLPDGRIRRRRPHFVHPRAEAKDDAEGTEETGSRDLSQRLAAVEAVIGGAEAAGWKADYRFGRGEHHTDAACWKDIHGREVRVAFRVQLGHRLRFEFGDKEREYRDRGVQLVWLLSDRHAAQEPSRPEGIPVVKLRAAGDGGPHDGFLVDTWRLPGPARALALEDYVETLLQEVALRLDPEARPLSAPIGWLTCRSCGRRSLGFGNFDAMRKGELTDVGWRMRLLPGRSLDPAHVADRRALLAFRDRVAELCFPDSTAELSWSAPEGFWRATFHCPAHGCGLPLAGPMVPRQGRPNRVAARLRLSVPEIDALIDPFDGLGVGSSVFAPLRVGEPPAERAAEALEAAKARLAGAEARHQELADAHRATLAEIAQANERLSRMAQLAEDWAADGRRLAGLEAQEGELPGLRARLLEVQPLARELPALRTRVSALREDLAIVAQARADRVALAEAARVAGGIERRIAEHDAEATELLERHRAEWRAAEIAGSFEARTKAYAATREWLRSEAERNQRLENRPWPIRLAASLNLFHAAWARFERRRLAARLRSARAALARGKLELTSPEATTRWASAFASEAEHLAETRAGLEREREAALAAGRRLAALDSSLEAVAGLDAEHASAAPRLADAEAAACEAAEVAAGLARAERAAAEAARLRHRMAETELALRSRALLEVELQGLARRAPEIEEAVGRSRAELRAARDAAALAEADLAFAAKGGVPRAGVMAAE